MPKKLRLVLIFIIWILIIINLIMIAQSVFNKNKAPSFFGIKTFAITSGSMKPGINEGDVVITKNVKENELQQGDIITFRKGDEFVTHRIQTVKESNGKKLFITKGDNNDSEDSGWTSIEDVEGKVAHNISHLGYGIKILKNKILIIAIVLLFFVLYCIDKVKNKNIIKRLIYLLIITTMLSLSVSAAEFKTKRKLEGNAVIAIPIFSSTTIDLENVYPDMETKKYEIVVENSQESIRSEVSLGYYININAIGNVPLIINLYEKNNGEVVGENLLNNGKTDLITMGLEEVTKTYELEVEWDKTIEDYNSYKYSGETSLVEIKVQAVQTD